MSKAASPFWMSRKFWFVVMAGVIFGVVAVTKTVIFSAEQMVEVILSLAGISVGGHVVSDIAAMITGREQSPAAVIEQTIDLVDTNGEPTNDLPLPKSTPPSE